MIISAGIREVVYENEYRFNRQVAALFREARVRFRRFAGDPLPRVIRKRS